VARKRFEETKTNVKPAGGNQLEERRMEKTGLLLCSDLMWISRITGTAKELGGKILAARDVDKLEELARQHSPVVVILDLGDSAMAAAEIVQRINAACPSPPRLAAYGSHVDVATLHAARDAGCDPVLPRSAMAQELPNLLREWLK
jgi:CheY-like chemotaxis protein